MHKRTDCYTLVTLNAFKCGIFPIKATQDEGLKLLTPKQMLQRLPIALPQVKSGKTSENLLIEIRHHIFFVSNERSY